MALTLKALQEQINSLRQQVEDLKSSSKVSFIHKKLGVCDTFEFLGLTWKILDITDKGYMCLADNLDDEMQFDSKSNNWSESGLREYLNNEFFNEIAEVIGVNNIIPFERDLLSLDGLTEYGSCEDKISLLTVDEYRKYRALISNTNDYWWWLLTADSCKSNNNNCWVRVVSPRGNVDCNCCDDSSGVRPFCIFSSSIFESEE